ncbi:Sec1-binding region of Mso1-domain-containing protein [Stachybotrys elegans]|uniref:Sec1-binding region of Mso1-domain-containing protein n=1 Tax=Stachybotrys elegans TaxID=80388 RepID=A0A8K0SR50_9HYPO|nr:Sec1-binding region of Mso1-domain-containing protein [Stachybotrys elegans]
MASWYSNILTKTSSQISSLRSTLLASEADGDTEDDTHVCRVLRNYYTDKGRPFPPWLPPDPKAPTPAPQQVVYAQPQVGARYGGLQNNNGGGSAAPQTGLSSLWDNNAGGGAAASPRPSSLRAGRTPVGGARQSREEIQPRPLPSQRPGSHQSAASAASVGSGSTGGGASAQDRLRQRLWGGARTTSPSQQGSPGPFQPPAGGRPPAGGGGGGGGDYEDRFAPGGAYDPTRSTGSRSDRPYVSANSPWSDGGDPYGGGGQPQPQQQQQAPSSGRRMGLPSGPRGYR